MQKRHKTGARVSEASNKTLHLDRFAAPQQNFAALAQFLLK